MTIYYHEIRPHIQKTFRDALQCKSRTKELVLSFSMLLPRTNHESIAGLRGALAVTPHSTYLVHPLLGGHVSMAS